MRTPSTGRARPPVAKPPLTLAPRYFSHSSEPSGKVLRKRKGYPEHLQKSHVMVTGGREGPLVSAKKVPREERPTLTGWKGAPSAGWTTELEKDGTPKDARTQSGYLRRVRPEQRAWAPTTASVLGLGARERQQATVHTCQVHEPSGRAVEHD